MTKHIEDAQSLTLGERIRLARENLGLQAQDLAKSIGVGSAIISRWENGKQRPRARSVLQISRVLGVTTDWLMTGEVDEDAQTVRLPLAHPSPVFTKWVGEFGAEHFSEDELRWFAAARRPDGKFPQHVATYRMIALALMAPDA